MRQSFEFRIGETDAGARLDEFLWSRFGRLSRMRVTNLLDEGACLVNAVAAAAASRLAAGDTVSIAFDDDLPTAMDPDPLPLEILHEDEHVIVVVKPAGLLVHPTRSVKRGTLANALAYHLNRDFYGSAGDKQESRARHGAAHTLTRPGLVHRLDRATSGLMVVAKTPRALGRLSNHFRRRIVSKRYLALARGLVGEDAGVIKAPIGRDPDSRPQWRVTESGKAAETRFLVRERLSEATLLELEPVTGRTNQLRIHCAHLGHPIVGDEYYGGAQACEAGFAARLCLHAWRLAFHHPADGRWMEFTSALPPDITAVVERLRV